MKNFLRLALFALVAFALFGAVQVARAETVVESKTSEYCNKDSNRGSLNQVECAAMFGGGYMSGYEKKNVEQVCKGGGIREKVCKAGFAAGKDDVANKVRPDSDADCGDGVKVSGVWGSLVGSDRCVGGKQQNPIYKMLSIIIGFASGILGLVLVLMVVISGLQYVTSEGNPDRTKSAKDRLKGAATGLVLFVIMFAFLQLILPEGSKIFGG